LVLTWRLTFHTNGYVSSSKMTSNLRIFVLSIQKVSFLQERLKTFLLKSYKRTWENSKP
jgi:hypothetical protein